METLLGIGFLGIATLYVGARVVIYIQDLMTHKHSVN